MEYRVAMFPLGSTTITEPQRDLQFTLAQMRRFGHAVEYDEQYDAQGKWLTGRVTHFLTCRACLEEARSDGQVRSIERPAASVSTGAELPTESRGREKEVPEIRSSESDRSFQLGAAEQEELRRGNLEEEYRTRSPLTASGRELRSFRPGKVESSVGRDVLHADGTVFLSGGSSSALGIRKETKDAEPSKPGMGDNERAKQRAANQRETTAAGDASLVKNKRKVTRRKSRKRRVKRGKKS